MSPKHRIGDWVRFYQNGRLVIGEIRYVGERVGGYVTYSTDIGTVDEDCVLESRPKEQKP